MVRLLITRLAARRIAQAEQLILDDAIPVAFHPHYVVLSLDAVLELRIFNSANFLREQTLSLKQHCMVLRAIYCDNAT